MDTATFLYDVPPALIETFCKIIDSGDDKLGWRGLAAHIVPSWLDVRRAERIEATGKSPTGELFWAWAQQNTTVADLQRVLLEMGHLRALHLFQPYSKYPSCSDGPSATDPQSPSEMSMPLSTDNVSIKLGSHVRTEAPECRYVITYSDVEEGTRNFHQDMKIGEGNFSEVYRAVKGNESFAVKLFKQTQKASWRELWNSFRKEMEVHHLCQHPNILELLSCFSEGDKYCLVYPYLPNGSLSVRLHDLSVEPPLFWPERLDIIKGTAKAVHYLHTTQPCTVICGNITSANILLDEGLQPKLSDFTTARLRPHSINQGGTITMAMSSHSNFGYLPEEYIRDGKLSVSLDVYSFGIVMMETITGLTAIQDSPKKTLLRDTLSGEMEDSGSVDSCLQYVDQRAGPWPHAVSLCLMRLALECTCSRPRSRPTMKAVLEVLSQLLPLPCPPEDQPHTLDGSVSGPPAQDPCSSVPVEDDEQHSYTAALPQPAPDPSPQSRPCECSQSEVTYISSGDQSGGISSSHESQEEAVNPPAASLQTGTEPVDLYSSWPVQCSCSSQVDGLSCEDCRANGFTSCR
uniref:Interleukin-1 receptor-associated kinase 3 n=1 Tax=Boleophthalmus pectinirostris TaxID=150288 RepID=A0A7D5HRF2_BOLPE|nr:interleukin-1 receptor-associated kinase 3 [Boleophthalmus pectinirostris]